MVVLVLQLVGGQRDLSGVFVQFWVRLPVGSWGVGRVWARFGEILSCRVRGFMLIVWMVLIVLI